MSSKPIGSMIEQAKQAISDHDGTKLHSIVGAASGPEQRALARALHNSDGLRHVRLRDGAQLAPTTTDLD